MTSSQDFKLREKQISPTFSYFLRNNTLLYRFLVNWLAHNKKITEKSVFHEAWSPEMTSQPFPVSCFWSHSLNPTGSEIGPFRYIKTHGKKIAIDNFSLLYLSVHWGDLIEQIKKICCIHFNWFSYGSSFLVELEFGIFCFVGGGNCPKYSCYVFF